MKFSTHEYTTSSAAIGNESFPISHKPAAIMDYQEAFWRISPNGDLAVVGYLVDDTDCPNPLVDFDGMGEIITARRNAGAKQHEKMQKALGLDTNWSPDLDIPSNDSIQQAFIDIAVTDKEMIERARNHDPAMTVKAFAEKLVEDGDMPSSIVYEKVLLAAWKEGRETGTIGDPLAVPLDVYEHGGVAYSVSGTGMQDKFDTSRGGALWLPDSVARENIAYQAIQALLPAGTEVHYASTTEGKNEIRYALPDGSTHGSFANFLDAIKAAAIAQDISLAPAVVLQKMRDIAIEDATSAAEQYTDWSNGNTFGYVLDTFIKTIQGEWEHDESDDVYGFIGDKYVLQEVSAEATAIADHQKELNERSFVACDGKALSVLANANAFFSSYDTVKCGVTITMTDEVQALIDSMPADFSLMDMTAASDAVKTSTAGGPILSASADDSPSP